MIFHILKNKTAKKVKITTFKTKRPKILPNLRNTPK